jgi:mannose-6-phosphate isomerase
MTQIQTLTQANRVRHWLYDQALPLWSSAGIDPSGVGAWEALNHDGSPQQTRDKRLRVMPRQAFVFASAGGDYVPLARGLFDFAMTAGIDPKTGNLAALLSPDGRILKAPHDLYDLAFMALAASALSAAGQDMAEAIDWVDAALGRLKAPRGWQETVEARMPRRQNPHMHLFEAATELYRVTGDSVWRNVAEECLGLFHDVFLQADGRIFEYFSEDWGTWPETLQPAQAVEPGHIAEWIWLLDCYERVMGQSSGVDLGVLWRHVLAGRDGSGLLYDVSLPLSETRRLWPQTELLKAGLVVGRSGSGGMGDAHPDRVLERLFEDYLEGPVPGGWYDKRRVSDGALVSNDMPSSTFYHLYVAAIAYLDAA